MKPAPALLGEPDVGLVHQRGWLQGVSVPFVLKVMVGQLPQLGVDERHELVEGAGIAVAPLGQEMGDVGHSRGGSARVYAITRPQSQMRPSVRFLRQVQHV